MAAKPTVPHPRTPVKLTLICIDHELADLALEIFITTYGCDWQQAFDAALTEFADLIAYADAYDEWAAAMAEAVQR